MQILLQQHRGELFVSTMKSKGVKPSDWLREQAYYFLEENLPEELYAEAKKKDEAQWREVVQNRLTGRAISKIVRAIRA
ncbi:hypothetical protein [Prochlorococcus marinus]